MITSNYNFMLKFDSLEPLKEAIETLRCPFFSKISSMNEYISLHVILYQLLKLSSRGMGVRYSYNLQVIIHANQFSF